MGHWTVKRRRVRRGARTSFRDSVGIGVLASLVAACGAPPDTAADPASDPAPPARSADGRTPATMSEPAGNAPSTALERVTPRSLGQIGARFCHARPAPDTERPRTVAERGNPDGRLAEARFGPEAVGGRPAKLAAFPGILKLESRRLTATGGPQTGHCGAVRIAPRWALTAAHCVDGEVDRLTLIAGVADLRQTQAAYELTGKVALCHAAYGGDADGFRNDLALIRLSDRTRPAADHAVPLANLVPTSRTLSPQTYQTADMAGWGLTAFDGGLSRQLLSAELTVAEVTETEIVVTSRAGAGPCLGDSGGPLYVVEPDGRRVLVGLLSTVEPDADGRYCQGAYRGRFVNLQAYGDWIERVMATCDASPELCEP